MHRELFGEFGDETSDEEQESNRNTIIAESEENDFDAEERRL